MPWSGLDEESKRMSYAMRDRLRPRRRRTGKPSTARENGGTGAVPALCPATGGTAPARARRALRRRPFRLALWLLPTLALPGAAAPPAPGPAPNVVLLMSDQHRWHAMRHAGAVGLQTPNLDRLAREGVSFTQALSNYPLCAPYRAMQLTGRWPYRTGILGQPAVLRRGQRTLAHAFREAGYVTGYIGKWHLGAWQWIGEHGFDHDILWGRTNRHWNAIFRRGGGPWQQSPRYSAQVMTDQALAFISQNRSKSFFLLVSWTPPHRSFDDAPAPKKALYSAPDLLPPRANAVLSDAEQEDYANYHAHVSALDDEIGRLRSALERWGLASRTILVYTSDHGEMLGSHGRWGKREPYEEAIRVPFLVAWEGHSVPRSVDALLSAVDVAPTLLGLAGLTVPPEMEGQDFSLWVKGGEGPDPGSAFLMNIEQDPVEHLSKKLFRGVRTRTHTYVATADGPWLLFDNVADPHQRTNLVADGRQRPKRDELHALVRKWLEVAGDPFPLP